jgi:hypothetical protein
MSLRERARFLFGLCLVAVCQVGAQVLPLPENSLVRIKTPNGERIYGCASPSDKDTTRLLFRIRKPFAPIHYGLRDCVDNPIVLRTSDLESIELGQADRSLAPVVTKWTLIGAATGGGIYWSLGDSKKKCRSCFINTPTDWIVTGGLVGGLLAAAIRSASPGLGWIPWKAGSIERPLTGWQWFLDKAKLEGTAGAGFAGIRVAEVLKADSADTTYLPVANYRYDWRPAVSTGIVSYIFSSRGANLGAGIGIEIVSLPTTEGKTLPFPAITFHAGTLETEFFGGLVLSPTDSVHVPTDVSGKPIRQSLRVNPDNFLFRNTRTSRHLFIGIQVKGTRKGASDIGTPEGVHIEMDFDTTATMADTVRLFARLVDSAGNTLAAPPAKFELAFGRGTVEGNKAFSDSVGLAVVRAKIGTMQNERAIHFRKVDTPSKSNSPKAPPSPADTVRMANGRFSPSDAYAERFSMRYFPFCGSGKVAAGAVSNRSMAEIRHQC